MTEKSHHLHLVSDSTGETISSVARACLVQFEGVEPVEHVWPLIRTAGQVDRVLNSVRSNPGPVLYTIIDDNLRYRLIEGCYELKVPSIAVLDPVLHTLAAQFQVPIRRRPGLQHAMDAGYLHRIEAMDFVISHDDGQGIENLHKADVVIVGVSRTSKTPTCLYLGNRGIKAANVPFVPNVPLPPVLTGPKAPFVVGLTKDAGSLAAIRRTRLRHIGEDSRVSDYADVERVQEELRQARQIFSRNGWTVIDVTRRSIEETAASIMAHLQERSAMRAQA